MTNIVLSEVSSGAGAPGCAPLASQLTKEPRGHRCQLATTWEIFYRLAECDSRYLVWYLAHVSTDEVSVLSLACYTF